MNRSVTQPIDVPTVLAIHDLQIRRHGGSGGVRSLSCLEGCVASPWMSFAGEDLYPTLCEKAVRLGYEVITQHPFVDGNKRTGLALMLVLLREGGNAATFDHGELLHSILSVANGDLDYDGLLTFVRKSVRP